MSLIRIIGGGLAGAEAAWQAARRGVRVVLHEMRPVRPTAVHKTDRLAELVCSNSFRGDKLDNAVGLLKEEMRRLGSLVLRAAADARVPAGAALAVDRARFADTVTAAVTSHPLITVVRGEVPDLPAPDGVPTIVATGPLTSDALSHAIQRVRRSGTPGVLRRHQPDCPRREHRSHEGVSCLAVGPKPGSGDDGPRTWPRTARRGLPAVSTMGRGTT